MALRPFEWKEKELSFQVFLRSFGLTQKNQKVKAYTPAATNSRRGAEISENSLRSNGFIFLFFWLDPKEPKGQGLHSSGYKFAARSGNLGKLASLRQPRFLFAPLGICFTPLPLGQPYWELIRGCDVNKNISPLQIGIWPINTCTAFYRWR